MTGATLHDGAMLVAAVAVLMVGLAALLLVWRKAFQSVTVKAGSMEASLRAVEKDVAQINRAVNHVSEGSPTLVQRVTETEAKIDTLLRRVDAIGKHVGCNPPTERDMP